MLKIKKIFSWIVLVIGGLMGALLPMNFSVAQNYGPTDDNLFFRSFTFRMPNYPLYLYVITEPNTYRIHFNGNWSTSWSMDSMNMTYDEERYLLENKFIKDGYDFQWWSRSVTWAVEYLDKSWVKNLTTVNSGEVTLYAQREWGVTYVVEYYQENVAWTGYDLVWTGIMSWKAWTWIILTWKEYTWFTLQTGDEITISSWWVVPYYYTRNPYDLAIEDRGNTTVITWIKYWADIPLPADPEWTWNTFDGWDNLPWDGKMPANDLKITSKWTYGVHMITFDTDGWTEIEPITGNYGDSIIQPQNPTREWYEFVGWEPGLPNTIPYDDIVVKAIWKEITKWSWWSGRWWGWWWGWEPDWWWQPHESAWEPWWTWIQIGWEWVDLETFFAYMWAHDMWIIEETWKDSDPDGYVTRWAMAEMVVKFTEKVLWREIPERIPRECVWWDKASEWKTREVKMYAEKACALWVMWIRMKDFMPNKILDRAEFGTILSRLLWWDKYDVVDATKTKLYYTRHLNALKENKIMTDIENPEMRKELRKWAWLMLLRARVEERHQM